MKFNYFARNRKGELQTGTVEAPNQSAAIKTLQDRKLIIIKFRSVSEMPIFGKKIKLFDRVKRKETFVFFRQLAILIEADVPLVQSLRALANQSDNEHFKEIIFSTANDVDGGTAFSKALSKNPKAFSNFAINLVKTGEFSGRLQQSLIYLADYLEKEYYLISKVRGAMVYPAFILATFVVVGVLVLVMVIPSLTAILLESGQELPWSTKLVIAVSDFLLNWGWIILLGLVGFVIFVLRYKKTKQGRFIWDTAKLKIPIFGKILQKTYLARLADNLNALVKGGVPIIQSLNISGQVVGNVVFQKILYQARDRVKSGQTISSTFEQYKIFPPLFNQMIRTGEQSGKLDIILGKLSSFYNKEVDNIVNNLSQLIEPVLIVGLALGVAVLVFAVFMPIYNLAGSF